MDQVADMLVGRKVRAQCRARAMSAVRRPRVRAARASPRVPPRPPVRPPPPPPPPQVYKYKSRFGFPDALFTPELTQTVERTWRDETLPRHLGFFIRCLAESPTGWLAGTRAPTVADLLLACVLRTDVANAAPLPQSLLAFVDAVYSLPAVKAFKQAEEAAR